jgi:hypothetical protein
MRLVSPDITAWNPDTPEVYPDSGWLSELMPKPEPPETTALIPVNLPVDKWVETYLGLTPDPIQAGLLNSPAHRLILCCTRQWGKSTIIAAKALHMAASNPGSLTLFAAASQRQSDELLLKLRLFAWRITGEAPRGDGLNAASVMLPNTSRIVAVPESPNTIRGFSAPALIVIDEAAFVSDELFHAITPSLAASNGALWLLSSPNGESGFFYDIWTGKPAGWASCRVTAPECPRISAAFLDSERLIKGEPAFRQEYLCEFVNGGGQIFSRDLIESGFDDRVDARF